MYKLLLYIFFAFSQLIKNQLYNISWHYRFSMQIVCSTAFSYYSTVDSSVMPIGFTVSIASSVLLGVVMLCYIVMCFCTSSLGMFSEVAIFAR